VQSITACVPLLMATSTFGLGRRHRSSPQRQKSQVEMCVCFDWSGHLTAMLRSLVIGKIGGAGQKAVVDEAKKRFAAHCDGSAELPADLRSAVSPRPSVFIVVVNW